MVITMPKRLACAFRVWLMQPWESGDEGGSALVLWYETNSEARARDCGERLASCGVTVLVSKGDGAGCFYFTGGLA